MNANRRPRQCFPKRSSQVVAFVSDLPWELLGGGPEMLRTAYGSLVVGLDVQPGQTLLVRGGTSSVGMTAAILAKRRGLHGVACFTGMLSNSWVIEDFYPIDFLPAGARLTA